MDIGHKTKHGQAHTVPLREHSHQARCGGFALPLIAALLIVASLAVTTLLVKQDREAVWHPQIATKEQVRHIADALISFQRTHHRLPCPAAHDQLPDSINFGREGANCSLGGPINGTSRHALGGGIVMRLGVLPVRTLGLPNAYNADEWANRFTYAVDERFTDPFQFSDVTGTMHLNGESGTSITDGAFAVISHGPDSKGAYTLKAGVIGTPCTSSAGYDRENCNNDGIFAHRLFVPQEGSSHFDDQITVKEADAQAKGINTPCYPTRTPTPFTWTGTVDGHCSAPFINMLHGETQNLSNTMPENTGTATVRCNNGTLETVSGTCEYTPSCPAANISWTGTVTGCNAARGNLAHGASTTLSNSATGRNGSVTVSCNKGVITQSGGTCNGDSCTLPWVGSLAHGGSTTAYATSSVACGATCASQVRSCSFGVLSGSYSNAGCSAATCANCALPWGGTLAHNSSVVAWTAGSVPCGSSCASETRNCWNGSLSGSYGASSCATQPCAACSLPWGGTVTHGNSVYAYAASSVGCGGSCSGQTRYCNNGNLSGSYGTSGCSVAACPVACNLPWGGQVTHGGAVTAYAASSVACGASCAAETRSCNNGYLSGSFNNAGCSVQTCGGTWKVLNGGSVTCGMPPACPPGFTSSTPCSPIGSVCGMQVPNEYCGQTQMGSRKWECK